MAELEGIATVNVCGHEVPLPAYWRIVKMHSEGQSATNIVNTVMETSGSRASNSISEVVNHVIGNQGLMNKPGDSNFIRRSMAIKASSKPTGMIYAKTMGRLQEAMKALTCAEELEEGLANEAIDLMRTRKRFSEGLTNFDEARRVTNTEELHFIEAGLDRETKRTLQKRQAAEDEVKKLKMLIRKLEKRLAVEKVLEGQ